MEVINFDDYRLIGLNSPHFHSLIVTDASKYVLKSIAPFNKIPPVTLLYLSSNIVFLKLVQSFFNYSEIKRPSWYDEAVF